MTSQGHVNTTASLNQSNKVYLEGVLWSSYISKCSVHPTLKLHTVYWGSFYWWKFDHDQKFIKKAGLTLISILASAGLITDEQVLQQIEKVGDLGDTTRLRWECLKKIFLMRLDEPGAKVTDAPLDLYPHNVSTVIIIIKRRFAIQFASWEWLILVQNLWVPIKLGLAVSSE